MDITGVLRGLDQLVTKFADIKVKAKEAEVLGVTRVAIALRDSIVGYVDEGHPDHPEIKSGRLKASIRYVVDSGTPTTAVVGSDADYAPFVEFGHSQTPGRFVPSLGKRLVADHVKPYPFVRPAITDVFDGGIAQKLFKGAIKEKLKI
jgi:HK97 gp10 family phage protein